MIFHSFKKIPLSVVFYLFLTLPSAHASSTGASIFSFLKIGASARSSGMGEMAAIPSSLSLSMNPAALPLLGSGEVAFNHLSYISDINYSMVSCAFMLEPDAAISGTFGYLGAGGISRTEADASVAGYKESGNFNYNDFLFQTAYGAKIGREFSWGAAITGVHESIDNTSNSGIMFSAGGLYTPRKGKWAMGFGVKDFGPQVKGYDLPSMGYFGFGRRVTGNMFWGSEVAAYFDREAVLRTGLEYFAGSHVALRCGYRHMINDPALGDFPRVNFTAGMGFSIGQFALDYAWLPYGDLGDTHRVTLLTRFGKTMSTKAAGTSADVLSHTEKRKAVPSQVTIAVLDFNPKNVAVSDAVTVAAFFRDALAGMEKTGVVDRESVRAILEKQSIDPQNLTDAAAVAAGKASGAQQVMTGTFSRYLDTFFVSVRLFDVKTGVLIRSLDQSVEKAEDIRTLCVSMAEKLRQ